ncbi:hypothetical protein AFP07_10075 [Staphylococcus aureus]|nr:hypothetical protein [Staphylococcus aureus]OZW70710.1 hypothetical protein AFO89_08940 [Staphylococcus aureus]OZX22314.1 hypothetical protein AFP07_10075 [Staphylococcus aureus]RCV74614.1 hypothetical protein BJL72_04020 [Staphylococcus aureus]RCV84459.1 hypothetical protein BJL73_04025 [Staphylococcus aureus]
MQNIKKVYTFVVSISSFIYLKIKTPSYQFIKTELIESVFTALYKLPLTRYIKLTYIH